VKRSAHSEILASDNPGTATETFPLSIVVPVHNATETLTQVLGSIRRSDFPRDFYELIVVDDASADGSASLAARYADTVVKLTGRPSGPSYARNRGAEIARGQVIAFVDADVVVAPDTLRRMVSALLSSIDIAAVSASHGESSGANNFVSHYWNLLLRFGEEKHGGRGAQFAPECGVVRRSAFLDAGMYDEWRFATAGMEGVELGERLARSGHVVLDPDLTVTHLRKWDLASVCREVWTRGRMLSRSLGYFRTSAVAPSEVVFTLSRTLTPAVALVGTLMLAAAFVPAPHTTSKTGLALALLLLANFPIHRFNARSRGVVFAALSAPIHLFVQFVTGIALCAGWVLRDLLGDVSPDATTQAYAEVGLEVWPPIPRKR
jgi:hypothetical protein